jgi:3-mercaptopyruvate sulfurtransferase SseA
MSTFSTRIGAICSLCLLLAPALVRGNSENYPEFAALTPSHDIKAEFIHVDQLVEDILARKKVMIVDVRSPGEYASQHIKGAISLPLRDLSANVELIPKEGLVALY